MVKPLLFIFACLPIIALQKTESSPTLTSEDYMHYIPLDQLKGEPLPEFGLMATNVTVQREDTAFIHCPVKRFGDRAVSYPQVSWVRIRDWHILTHGLVRFTTDDRFNILYTDGSYDWILKIAYSQESDGGLYECQVSTASGLISARVLLTVIYPEAKIQGGNEYHVDAGSPVVLICIIDSAASKPNFIFWYHNERMVNYDTERGVVVVTSSSQSSSTESRLSFSSAGEGDRGNYTCSPSNTQPATVQLFVTGRDGVLADPVMRQDGTSEALSVHRAGLTLLTLLFLALRAL